MLDVKLAFFNFSTFAAVAAMNSQLIPFINESGYSITQKGFILGLSALGSIGASLGFGWLSDRQGKMRTCFLWAIGSYAGFSFLAILTPYFVFKAICLILAIGIVRIVMSMNETWTFLSQPQKFGIYHCMSAIGLVAGALISGWLAQFNRIYSGLFCIACALIAGVMACRVKEKERPEQPIAFSACMKLLGNEAYVRLLFLLFLLMLMGFADQYVVVDKLLAINPDRMWVTYKFALQSLAEIPFYLASVYFFRKFDVLQLLLVAIVMSGVKFGLYGLVQHPGWLLSAAMLQAVTHPVIVLTSKQLIQRVTPEELRATAQIAGFAVYFGLSGFAASLLAAWFVIPLGVDRILFGFASISILAVMVWSGMKKSGKYDTLNTEK